MNVITSTSSRGNDNPDASSNVSHSPGHFIQELGAAYRASGRSRPIFDTVGHHPYGEHPRERPWRSHPLSTTIGEGDWDKLVQAYHDAFAGTAQPTPGRCVEGRCAPIWYMELGFQTSVPPGLAWAYRGAENVANVVPAAGAGDPPGGTPDDHSLAPDQGTQLADAVRLAYCQPYVGAYFNFILRDEADLAGWQSGLLWPDWTPKPAFASFAGAAAAVKAGEVDCAHVHGATPAAGSTAQSAFPPPRTDVRILRTVWPHAHVFNWRNDLWRFRVAAAEDATCTATLVSARRPNRPLLRTQGRLKRAYLTFVTFARRRLVPGRAYRFRVTVTSAATTARTTELTSPSFFVTRPRPRR